jgi:uncharacterized coiled-coil protein SlyX
MLDTKIRENKKFNTRLTQKFQELNNSNRAWQFKFEALKKFIPRLTQRFEEINYSVHASQRNSRD